MCIRDRGVAYAAQAAGVAATIVMPTTTPLVKVNNTKDYGAQVILHGEVFDDAAELAARMAAVSYTHLDLSLEVNKGEIVALIGPNGAGKTTAFNCITGVYEPTNGRISFLGQPMVENFPQGKMKKTYQGENQGMFTHKLAPTPDQITHMGMARTFQNIRLFSSLSVLDLSLIHICLARQ